MTHASDRDVLHSSASLPAEPELAQSLQLLARAKRGDADALNSLFARYYERIYRIVRIRMGAALRGVLEPSDLVQNACMVAMQNLDSFEPKDHSSIIRWLARIAEHQVQTAMARATAQKRDIGRVVPLVQRADSGASASLEAQVPDLGPSPSRHTLQAELKEIYDACVERLPDDYRELILARDYTCAGWEEVAQELGVSSVHALHQKYFRAQKKLAEELRRRIKGYE